MTRVGWAGGGLFLMLTLWALVDEAKPQEKPARMKVDGIVLDSDRKPLLGVEVGIYVLGKSDTVDGVRIRQEDGSYSLMPKVSDSFFIIFSKSNYRSCVIKHLADGKDHRISVVLYRKGERTPAEAAHSQIQSIDSIRFLSRCLSSQAERNRFLYSVGGGEALISSMDEKFELTDDVPKEVRSELELERVAVLKRFATSLRQNR